MIVVKITHYNLSSPQPHCVEVWSESRAFSIISALFSVLDYRNLAQQNFGFRFSDSTAAVSSAVIKGPAGTFFSGSKWAEELCRVRVDKVMGSDKAHRPQLFFTAGVHPHEVKNCDESTISELRQLAASPYCVAIGECGLDYDRMFSAREEQLAWFDKQVALASDLHMPLFLHERDRGRGGGPLGSDQDCLRILSKHGIDPKLAVFHCFTGSRKVAQEYIQKGYWIGLTG
ncbi:hypothetical protein FOZ62_031006, partial [Perkinsus olseni]